MSPHEAVAAEVRAQLARKRLSGVRAARALGWTQNYISRRLTGTVPFDVADLVAVADLLEVPVDSFFAGVRCPGILPSPQYRASAAVRWAA